MLGTQTTDHRSRFALHAKRIDDAIDAGIDIAALRVDPRVAMFVAMKTQGLRSHLWLKK